MLQDVIAPTGYVLCGTPRTGSTLLCSLLASTGVLGRPESYFREPGEARLAMRFNLPVTGERVRDYRAFVGAVRNAASTDNGVFAARIMWGSLERVRKGLDEYSSESDVAVLERTFGRLAFIHLVRDDVVAQAVSWARAEQTGYWQQGDPSASSPKPDLRQLTDLLETIREHDANWRSWFASNGIEPHRLTYDELVQQPRRSVRRIADHVQIVLPADWQPVSPHRKQADRVNTEWAQLLQETLNRR